MQHSGQGWSANLWHVRRPAIVLGALALAAALVIGIVQASGRSDTEPAGPLTRAEVAEPIAGAPPELAALRSPINARIDGGSDAFDAKLRSLRGHPVVVNAWASWCDPCRFELPFFQRQAMARGAKVVFLGLNVDDAPGRAKQMADRYPMPYPSFVDRDSEILAKFRARGLPVTVFYDARGRRQMVHQGVFASEQELSDAIERYALR